MPCGFAHCDKGPSTKERLELSNFHSKDAAMDGELLSCELKCSTHLGQSSSMTRKDRDLLRFDAGHFWIVDTSYIKQNVGAHAYLTLPDMVWNRAIACSIVYRLYRSSWRKPKRSPSLGLSSGSRWRDLKGRSGERPWHTWHNLSTIVVTRSKLETRSSRPQVQENCQWLSMY